MVSAHILAKYMQEVTHKVSQFEKNMRLAPAGDGSMGCPSPNISAQEHKSRPPAHQHRERLSALKRCADTRLIIGCIQEPFDAPDTRWMTQLAQCFRLYLADTLAGDVKLTANLF